MQISAGQEDPTRWLCFRGCSPFEQEQHWNTPGVYQQELEIQITHIKLLLMNPEIV